MAAWVVQSGRSQMMDLGVGYCVGHNKRPHGSGTKKRYSPTQPNKSLESGCHGCRFYCFLPSRHKTHKTWEGTSGMHLKNMDWETTASCREKKHRIVPLGPPALDNDAPLWSSGSSILLSNLLSASPRITLAFLGDQLTLAMSKFNLTPSPSPLPSHV